jgi:16S rRNA (guanine527-N7)-methyltransferase
VSRAVTDLPTFMRWVWSKITPRGSSSLANGILCLKGGDLSKELAVAVGSRQSLPTATANCIIRLSDFFEEEFFETKKLVYVKR